VAPAAAETPSGGADATAGSVSRSPAQSRRREGGAAGRRDRARKAAARKAAAGEVTAAAEATVVPKRSGPPSSVVRVGSLLSTAEPADESHTELVLAAGILLALVMLSGSFLSVARRTMKGGRVS
jgi:hypothetical protein